jgi:hypothetical protein
MNVKSAKFSAENGSELSKSVKIIKAVFPGIANAPFRTLRLILRALN